MSGWFIPAVVTALVAPAAAVLALRAQRPAFDAVPVTFQALFVLGALAAGAVLLRLTVFVVVPTAAGWSLFPGNPFLVRHSCVSAYYVAARAVTQVPDVYDNALYSFPQVETTGPRNARMLGPFRVDPYEYPPTFLPIPRLLQRLAPDFFDFRRLWFALNLLVVAVGLIAVARRVDTASRHAQRVAHAIRDRAARDRQHPPDRQRPARVHRAPAARDARARARTAGDGRRCSSRTPR